MLRLMTEGVITKMPMSIPAASVTRTTNASEPLTCSVKNATSTVAVFCNAKITATMAMAKPRTKAKMTIPNLLLFHFRGERIGFQQFLEVLLPVCASLRCGAGVSSDDFEGITPL